MAWSAASNVLGLAARAAAGGARRVRAAEGAWEGATMFGGFEARGATYMARRAAAEVYSLPTPAAVATRLARTGTGTGVSVPRTARVTMDFAADVGQVGGRQYGRERLAKLSRYLERRGVTLEVGSPKLPFGKAGAFVAHENGTARLLLKADPANQLVWHELGHFHHWRQVGPDTYRALPRTVAFNAPEQHVFDLLENPSRWRRLTPEYRIHAAEYIEEVGGFR